jgi:hypothetical protein
MIVDKLSARLVIWALTLLLTLVIMAPLADAETLAQLIEGAKKEGMLRGQWGQNSFGGSEGFKEILAGMNKRYKLDLKGQYTPGPDMQRLMLRIIQENAAGQPASTDVYLGNAQAMFDGLKSNLLKPMTITPLSQTNRNPRGSLTP